MGPSKAVLIVVTASPCDSPCRLLEFTWRICWPTFRPSPDSAADPSGCVEVHTHTYVCSLKWLGFNSGLPTKGFITLFSHLSACLYYILLVSTCIIRMFMLCTCNYMCSQLTVICLMVTACCFVLAPPSMAIPSFLLTFFTGIVRISPCKLLYPPKDLPMSWRTALWRRDGRSEEARAMKSSRPVPDTGGHV